MTYRAKMKDGKVEFEGGVKPADGVELRVEIVEATNIDATTPTKQPSLSEVLLKFAGCMKEDTRTDGSINHDHYIYGSPKR